MSNKNNFVLVLKHQISLWFLNINSLLIMNRIKFIESIGYKNKKDNEFL